MLSRKADAENDNHCTEYYIVNHVAMYLQCNQSVTVYGGLLLYVQIILNGLTNQENSFWDIV